MGDFVGGIGTKVQQTTPQTSQDGLGDVVKLATALTEIASAGKAVQTSYVNGDSRSKDGPWHTYAHTKLVDKCSVLLSDHKRILEKFGIRGNCNINGVRFGRAD